MNICLCLLIGSIKQIYNNIKYMCVCVCVCVCSCVCVCARARAFEPVYISIPVNILIQIRTYWKRLVHNGTHWYISNNQLNKSYFSNILEHLINLYKNLGHSLGHLFQCVPNHCIVTFWYICTKMYQ